MTIDSDSSLAARVPAIRALRSSAEAKELSAPWSGSTEARNEQRVLDLIGRANALAVPPRFWFVSSGLSHGRRSLLYSLLRQRHCQAAVKALVRAGASIWPVDLAEGGRASFMNPVEVALMSFATDEFPRARCRACLAGALWGVSALDPAFFSALALAYRDARSGSSATSLGVLGQADQRAKSCSQILASQAGALRSACAEHCPGSSAAVEALLAEGALVLAAKARPAEATFDPEKLKKSLAPAQRARLRSLLALAESHEDDEDGLCSLMAATAWLAAQPQALCLRLRSKPSVAQLVLRSSSGAALRMLDALGSNLWLASAQAGEPNACLWAANEMVFGLQFIGAIRSLDRTRACLAPLARMLAYGAHLDGSPDPVGHAAQKAREASLANHGYLHEQVAPLFDQLISLIEALALGDILCGRPPSQPQRARL